MRPQNLALDLEPESRGPLHLRIARSVALAIRSGRLRPHQPLPSARALAEQLGTHRNTVSLAYQELEAEGWVQGRQGSGTFVAGSVPELTPLAWGGISNEVVCVPEVAGFDLPSRMSPLHPVQVVAFDLERSARPDGRLAPFDDMAKAVARGMRSHGSRFTPDADPMGHILLREQLSEWLSKRRGMVVSPEHLVVTRGGRMGLGLVLATLFPQGGTLAVESPGHPGLAEVLRHQVGLRVVSIPLDEQGLDLDALEVALASQDIRAVFLTPHAQQPTGATLSAERRIRLLELAARHRLAILEEDSDGEHHFDGPRPKPLAASDACGQVIHLGSLSRLMAPALRLGFIVAPKNVASRLARARQRMESHGDPALEWAMGDLIRDGVLDSHLLRVRRVYQERRDLMASYVKEVLGDRVAFERPKAGLALWLRANEPASFDDWLARARARGVRLEAGSRFSLEGSRIAATRMGFGAMDEAEMEGAFGLLRGL